MDSSVTEIRHVGRDRLLRAVRRWVPLVLLSAVVGGVGAFAASKALPPQYRATAQLFVAPVANPSVALEEVILGQSLARSYVQLSTAEVVLRPAMQKVGWEDLETFRDRTRVSQVRDTFVINVSFDLDDPVRAAAAANAIAESFVAKSRTVQSALQGSVTVWQPATPPLEPDSPRVALNTALGALGGALLVLLGIGAVSYIDDRISDPEQVRSRLGVVPMGEVHRGSQPESFVGKLFVRDSPQSREAESFRGLRTNIAFANVDRRPRSILVTSALPYEGKSVVSANLALAFAQAGTPTILIDADLRRPSQHSLFKVRSSQGLTNLLTGTLAPHGLQEFRINQHLIVVPSGTLPPNPAELLSSGRMSTLIQELIELTADGVVIIDTSPVLAVADPVALSTKVDGCLLVVDSARTNARAALQAVERLRGVNAAILGAVLNKVSAAHAYYGYAYYGAQRDEAEPSRPDSYRPRSSADERTR